MPSYPYDETGALGGLFAPAFIHSDPVAEAAVARWNEANLRRRPSSPPWMPSTPSEPGKETPTDMPTRDSIALQLMRIFGTDAGGEGAGANGDVGDVGASDLGGLGGLGGGTPGGSGTTGGGSTGGGSTGGGSTGGGGRGGGSTGTPSGTPPGGPSTVAHEQQQASNPVTSVTVNSPPAAPPGRGAQVEIADPDENVNEDFAPASPNVGSTLGVPAQVEFGTNTTMGRGAAPTTTAPTTEEPTAAPTNAPTGMIGTSTLDTAPGLLGGMNATNSMAVGAPTSMGLGPGFGPDQTATQQDVENATNAVASYGVTPGIMGTQVGIGFGIDPNSNIGIGFAPSNTQMTGTVAPAPGPLGYGFDQPAAPVNAAPVANMIDLAPGLSLGTPTQTSPTGMTVGPPDDDFGFGAQDITSGPTGLTGGLGPGGGLGPSGPASGISGPAMGSTMDLSNTDLSGVTGATAAPGVGTSAPGMGVAETAGMGSNAATGGFGAAPAATEVSGQIGGIADMGNATGMGYGGGMLGGSTTETSSTGPSGTGESQSGDPGDPGGEGGLGGGAGGAGGQGAGENGGQGGGQGGSGGPAEAGGNAGENGAGSND